MTPDSPTFGFEIGPYWIQLPAGAEIDANVIRRSETSYEIAWTDWMISLERFQFFVHLDPRLKLSDLRRLIEQTTKSGTGITTIGVNGIPGVTHGDYGPPRTWIDWWLKKGDVMLCLCLQSRTFPFTEPSPEEKAEHAAIIDSIRFAPEVAGGAMPVLRAGTSS